VIYDGIWVGEDSRSPTSAAFANHWSRPCVESSLRLCAGRAAVLRIATTGVTASAPEASARVTQISGRPLLSGQRMRPMARGNTRPTSSGPMSSIVSAVSSALSLTLRQIFGAVPREIFMNGSSIATHPPGARRRRNLRRGGAATIQGEVLGSWQ
jgi:hypothetical protein